MIIKDEILVLCDDRPGTASQAVGLAKEIGLPHKIFKLNYSFFSRLPNFFLGKSLLGLDEETYQRIKDLKHLPRLIISSGRRSAPVALFLKNLSRNRSKIVQIMHPNLPLGKFDFVILPKHDCQDERKHPNLLTSVGSLTQVSDSLIAHEKEKFAPWFQNIEKTKIAVLLGGDSKNTKFEKSTAIKLGKLLSKIANNMDAKLLVLNSRRSGKELSEALKSNLTCDFDFFDWEKVAKENPYMAILGWADFFVITGDSVSMISECCATAKPVYVFDDKKISAKKHRKFHHALFAQNYAKKLLHSATKLENFLPQKLQETKRISTLIRRHF
jgi:mitochondrial fission protein ELM1